MPEVSTVGREESSWKWSKREEDLKDSQDYSNLSEDCLRLISALKPGLCPNLSEDCLRLEEHEVAEPAGDPDPDQQDDVEVRLLLLDMDKAEETSGDTAAHDLENIELRHDGLVVRAVSFPVLLTQG